MKTLKSMPVMLYLALSLLLLSTGFVQAQSVEIETADGSPLVKLTRDGGRVVKVKDAAGKLLLKGKPRQAGGRKYKDAHGGVVAKVSGDDQSFKLKTERGGLLWKIKHYGDRIKISANDDNLMPEVLHRKSTTKWSLERDGQAYAKLRYYPDKRESKLKDSSGKTRYRIRNEKFSPMLGLLHIPGMQQEQAYIIMAEIWLRGW